MKQLLIASFCIGSLNLLSQVGIGTSMPDASAVLEVQSTQKGLLIPRMSSTDRDAIASPATGLMIFNTTEGAFQYYTGSGWSPLGLTTVSNADVAANAAIAFSKLNISASDIQGLGAYSDYTAGVGLDLNNSEFSVSNSVVTNNYGGSVQIAGTLNSGGTGHSSAILAATSTSKGFLPPRMTAAQRALISSPTEGLMVYQTDGIEGIYAFDGSNWLHNSQWYANTATTPSVFSLSKPASLDATGASANIGIGSGTLSGLTSGDNNVALGVNALNDITTFGNSTAVGYASLSTSTGSGNTAVGYTAGSSNISGSNNTFIGNQANAATNGLSNATALGYASEVQTDNTIQLGNGSVTLVNTSGAIVSADDITAGGDVISTGSVSAGSNITTTSGQIGIGTSTPTSSAALEISSTSKGLLLPRLTSTERGTITTPEPGLIIFNTTTNKAQVYTTSTTSWLDYTTNNDITLAVSSAQNIAQTFTAVSSESLAKLQLNVYTFPSSGTVTATLYDGSGTSGTVLGSTSLAISTTGTVNFIFNTPIPLTIGSTYTVNLTATGGTSVQFWADQNNPYSGGAVIGVGGLTNWDLDQTLFVSGTWSNLN